MLVGFKILIYVSFNLQLNVTPETIPTNVSILVVPPSDTSALYSCEASNEAGKDYSNITLLRTGTNLVNITQPRTGKLF